jgi:rhomboid protease GluP
MMANHHTKSEQNTKPYATIIICLGILLYWTFIALHSGQALYEVQNSQLLLRYGAVNGPLFNEVGCWRIIVSQFTHVRFFHMLGNVIFVFIIGTYIERKFGSSVFLLVYFVGGIIGQCASVFFNPNLISSGASQALCSLAGFFVMFPHKVWHQSKLTSVAVILFILVQCFLDLYFADRLKQGHTFGFSAGVIISILVFLRTKIWKTNRK